MNKTNNAAGMYVKEQCFESRSCAETPQILPASCPLNDEIIVSCSRAESNRRAYLFSTSTHPTISWAPSLIGLHFFLRMELFYKNKYTLSKHAESAHVPFSTIYETRYSSVPRGEEDYTFEYKASDFGRFALT